MAVIESCIPVVEQLVSNEYRLLDEFLHDFNLPVRFSLEGVYVAVGPHEGEEGTQLVEKDVELVCGLPIKTWDVSAHETQT